MQGAAQWREPFSFHFHFFCPSGNATPRSCFLCGVLVGSPWKDGGHWPNSGLCWGHWPGIREVGWLRVQINWPGFATGKGDQRGAWRRYSSKNIQLHLLRLKKHVCVHGCLLKGGYVTLSLYLNRTLLQQIIQNHLKPITRTKRSHLTWWVTVNCGLEKTTATLSGRTGSNWIDHLKVNHLSLDKTISL